VVKLDVVPPTFHARAWRNAGTFALESALDELSYALKMDPLKLRETQPIRKRSNKGTPFSMRNFKEGVRLGGGEIWLGAPQSGTESMRDGNWLVGYGVATAYYPTYQNPGAAPRADLKCGCERRCSDRRAMKMGMGTATAQAPNTTDALGLPV